MQLIAVYMVSPTTNQNIIATAVKRKYRFFHRATISLIFFLPFLSYPLYSAFYPFSIFFKEYKRKIELNSLLVK
jgi:hypothetical protein